MRSQQDGAGVVARLAVEEELLRHTQARRPAGELLRVELGEDPHSARLIAAAPT
jgi:hypothetical protein